MLRYVISTIALVSLIEVSIAAPRVVQTYPNPHSQTAQQLTQEESFKNQPINYGEGPQSQPPIPGALTDEQHGTGEPYAPEGDGQAINPKGEHLPQN